MYLYDIIRWWRWCLDCLDKSIMKRLTLLLMMFLMVLMAFADGRIKVACVGNSVTWGYGLTNREADCYPVQLQRMLGDKYDVRNFGHSGSTLLSHGHRPYIDQKEYKEALAFKADRVIIHLGLNDTDPRNWPEYAEEFNANYIELVNSFRKVNPKAQIWVCLMSPIFERHPRFESGTRDWHSLIQQHIKQVATAENLPLIDLYTPLHNRPDLFADALHPNAEGAKIIAETVYKAMTGNYGGLSLAPLYTDGMVMQRNEPIIFRGSANAKMVVKVSFDGQNQSTTAADDGTWSVNFPARKAGGPYKAIVAAGKERLTLKDIYVGEVWLCSGQSNMELPISAVQSGKQDLAEAGSQPLIHLFNMSTRYPTNAVSWSEAVCDSVNRHQLMRVGPWRNCSAESLSGFSAVAYHFAKGLADSLQVPIGVICNAVGGTTTESWIDRSTLEKDFPAILRDWYHGDFGMKWARERALQNIANSKNPLQQHPYAPAYMFETAMTPLLGYTLRGIVWYQGESNAHNIELHERLFPLLEKSWRNFFQQKNMPFYFVQLSSLNRRSWPRFRDSQRRMALGLEHTWMTVTSDLGDSLDVHYTNKKPVGERLAMQVLHHSYGHDIVSEGPVIERVESVDGGLLLTFSNAKELHFMGNRLIGFELAGADGIYHEAQATIENGYQVRVSCGSVVAHPVSVRYGWQPFTRANLVNEKGLPCSTFETAERRF